MQKERVCGKIEANERWLICPECGRMKLARILPGCRAEKLALYCKRCGREVVVNILPEPEP